MTRSLHLTTFRALSWSFLDATAQVGIQFIVGIVLARLLFPAQFGLIGMLTIFIAVSQTFLDSGFGAALIQRREVSQTDICSVFYFNILVGCIAAGVLCLIAPWIAAFYGQPLLTPLARALSLTIVINSFGMIQKTLLHKEIKFKAQTVASLLAGLVSGGVGITLAVAGFGVWSLVAQQIASALISTASLWWLSQWRPTLTFSAASIRGMFGFGSRLLFSSILNQLFENIYLVVIGRLFTATDLGLFARAKSLSDLPSQTLSVMVARVTFPVFATIQDDTERVKRGMKKALTALGAVNFPVMIGLAVVARPLIAVVLTDRWIACVPYLQLLCIVGLTYPLHLINLNVLQAVGRSDLFLRLEIAKKALIVVSIAVTWQGGINVMLEGLIAVSLISYYLNSYYNGDLVKYPFAEQVRDLFPYLAVSLLMGGVAFAIGLVSFPNDWSRLLAQVTAGALTYFALGSVWRLSIFIELYDAVRGTLAGRGGDVSVVRQAP